MDNRNEAIIQKIKGLLALANDHENDEESQSAFMMAQKLMMKYDISMSEVDAKQEKQEIAKGQVTTYKKLFWWERTLASIISENFKVKHYYNNKYLKGNRNTKRAIIFLGYEADVELAKEMYILAYDVLVFYSKRYVEKQYQEQPIYRSSKQTTDYKNSYMRGFLNGMKERFKEQVEQMEQEYGLMVLLPEQVKKTYDDMFKNDKGLSLKIPPIGEIKAYQQGYKDGKDVDYTKSTIDDEILN